MKLSRFNSVIYLSFAVLSAVAGVARAAVITGPSLTLTGLGLSVTGLGFTAKTDTDLTGFVFNSQSQADTVILTNSAGTTLDSIATSAGSASQSVTVDWSLSRGKTYWLFQTAASNELYADYGLALPSDGDISIIDSGTFDNTVAAAISETRFPQSNEYWAAFTDITTASGVPEPTPWAMLLLGLGGVGAALRRRPARQRTPSLQTPG